MVKQEFLAAIREPLKEEERYEEAIGKRRNSRHEAVPRGDRRNAVGEFHGGVS